MARLQPLAALLVVCALFVSCALFPASAQTEEASDVVILEDDNFDELTSQGDWFLEFYAPWCGHCKHLKPVWDELATKAKAKGLHVGKVDCTQNKEVANRFNIRGYPTIQLLKDKQLYAYKGARKVEDFLKFAEDGYKAVDPAPLPAVPVVEATSDDDSGSGVGADQVQILTSDNFTAATSGKWFIKFYAPWCGHCKNLAPTWEKAAQELKGKVNIAKVDCTTEGLLCQLFEVKGYPTLKFLKGDGLIRDYTGVREVEDFAEFVKKSHKQTTGKPYPLPAFLMHPLVFKFYKALEPVAVWVNDHIGYSFAIVTFLSLVLGFLVGRLTASSEVRYVIPKELGPQWNELLAQKKAHEERRQARQEEKKQKKQKKIAPASPATPARSAGEGAADSPRVKKRKNKAKKADSGDN